MDPSELADKLASWIKDKVSSAGAKGVVFGMSGGVDSSVLAVLCKRALSQNTLGLIMPCFSLEEDSKHALMVARDFSIPVKTVVLDSVFEALLKVLPDGGSRVALGNIKSRLRMLVLYYFSNKLNYLVAGSSNRSELSVGYFTKYGDGGADILPLGNLLKKEVRELASALGIPKEIVEKPPSAGLWEGQRDEEELGFTYEELDHYLESGEASSGVREKIEARFLSSRHKREPPQIAIF